MYGEYVSPQSGRGGRGTSSTRARLQGQAHRRAARASGCRYQTHEHRAEHWVVVSGKATCVIDGDDGRRRSGDSVDVAIGARAPDPQRHDEELVIIEVQRGDYTGEDDIVRLEDDYGRCADRAQ